MTDEALPFARYLKATGKGIATRYGRPHVPVRKGTIIALMPEEDRRYRREYGRQIAEGALEDVEADDYAKGITDANEAAVAARDKAAAEAEKAEADAKEAQAKTDAEAKKAAAKAKRDAAKQAAGGDQ
jgi:hypothetical protein